MGLNLRPSQLAVTDVSRDQSTLLAVGQPWRRSGPQLGRQPATNDEPGKGEVGVVAGEPAFSLGRIGRAALIWLTYETPH